MVTGPVTGRRLAQALLILSAFCVLALGAGAVSASGANVVTEFTTGVTAGSEPGSIVAGPDGNLWFTEMAGNRIGRISTDGTVTEFPLPDNTDPVGITVGPDNNLWFSAAHGIGRITTGGTVTNFRVPAPYLTNGLYAIAAGADGNLWSVDTLDNRIWRTTTTGTWTPFSTNINAQIRAIAAGPDGNLWFPEEIIPTGKLGRITPAGVITELPGGSSSLSPTERSGIVVGPDGNLWFTERAGPRIIRSTIAGGITEFSSGITPDGTALTQPFGIATGPDDALWFTEFGARQIGRITPLGTVTEYGNGSITGAPTADVIGSDGNLWFTEMGLDGLGQMLLGSSTMSPDITAATAIGTFPSISSGVLGMPAGTPPCGAGAGRAWFTFVAAAAGFYQASSLGSASPAAICVFSGSPGSLVRETASEEATTGRLTTARATAGFVGTAGRRYYILVSGAPATFHLVVQKTAAPPWMPVRMRAGDEWLPNASGQALAWTQLSSANLPYALVEEPGGTPQAFSSASRDVWAVGLSGGRLLVQRGDPNGPHSDLLLYDVTTRRQVRLPKAVNTKGWDFAGAGSLSGHRLVVVHGGDSDKTQTLVMVDLRKGRSTTVAKRSKKALPPIEGSSMAGSWVEWLTSGNRWAVHRYDTRHHKATATKPPSGLSDYAGSILPDGTVYFVRGGTACGDRIRLMRWRPGKQPEQVAAAPAGYDVEDLNAVQIGATTWAYMALFSCDKNAPNEDIVRVPVDVPGIGLVRSALVPARAQGPARVRARSGAAPASDRLRYR
jgi:virginiamycin B lyase